MRQERFDATRSGERTKIHRDKGKANWLLLYTALFLTALGVLFIYELTSVEKDIDNRWYYVIMQGTFGLYGLLCALIISKLDYRRINEICSCLLGFVILLIILLQIPGFGVGQVLTVGEMTISVPLVLMPALCLMLAKILCSKDDFVGIKVLGYWAASLILFIAISDYKGALCFSIIVFIMLFVEDVRYALLCSSIVVSVGAVLISKQDWYSWQRIAVWLDPFIDPNGRGYESIASLYTMASGGALGVGFGDNKAAYYLTDAKTTYIMAGIVREIGWVGAMLVIATYVVFLIMAVKIACRARDRFGFYLASVIMVRFAVMLVLNLFVTVNFIPAMRFSLPFISYGGSKVAVDYMLVGILLSISRCNAA